MSNNLTPRGGKKGRRTFAGQKMESPGAKRGGAGAHNWGDPMRDSWDEDIAALPDQEAQEAALRRQRAELAEHRAMEREYRRADEANRAAAAEFVQGQKAKKAALARHAQLNPYAMLDVEDEKDMGPPVDFAFASPAERIRAHQAGPANMAQWETALAEDRKIRNRDGLWDYPHMHPGAWKGAHPGMAMAPYGPHPGMPVSVMERAMQQEEHLRQMQMAQAEHIYQQQQRALSMEAQYAYYRGPNEKHGQRFQPRGHERYGH